YDFEQALGIHGPHLIVNIETIGLAANSVHLGSELAEYVRGNVVGCTMGRINDNFQTGQIQIVGKSAFAKLNITASRVLQATSATEPVGTDTPKGRIQSFF